MASDATFLVIKHIFDRSRRSRCRDHPFLIIIVNSAPVNFHKRAVIRSTWGNESNSVLIGQNQNKSVVRLVFLLGQVPPKVEPDPKVKAIFHKFVRQRRKDENLTRTENHFSYHDNHATLQDLIEEENSLHHDMIQGSFVDSYHNMTYKFVMGLKWVNHFCPTAQFILKTDDDIFVDIVQLISNLRALISMNYYYSITYHKRITELAGNQLNHGPTYSSSLSTKHSIQNLLKCNVNRNADAKRTFRSKWRVSFKVS